MKTIYVGIRLMFVFFSKKIKGMSACQIQWKDQIENSTKNFKPWPNDVLVDFYHTIGIYDGKKDYDNLNRKISSWLNSKILYHVFVIQFRLDLDCKC